MNSPVVVIVLAGAFDHDLLKAMEKGLPKFDLAWFSTVAFPAFETNYRVILKRSGAEISEIRSLTNR